MGAAAFFLSILHVMEAIFQTVSRFAVLKDSMIWRLYFLARNHNLEKHATVATVAQCTKTGQTGGLIHNSLITV